MPVDPICQDSRDEDGRRHRSDVLSLLPKDEREHQRLDDQHFLLRQILPGNCFAPVQELLGTGGTVLDVGCGTGLWGRDLARAYPQTQVIGFDLEDVAHPTSLPPTAHFVPGNLLTGLPFAAQSFE